MQLHYSETLGEPDAPGQLSGEAAERLPVVASKHQHARVLLPYGARPLVELEPPALGELDRGQVPGEAHRSGLERLAADPDGPLAVLRRVVHALHEVPPHLLPAGASPDSRRPPPRGVPGVVARRLVDHALAVELHRPA